MPVSENYLCICTKREIFSSSQRYRRQQFMWRVRTESRFTEMINIDLLSHINRFFENTKNTCIISSTAFWSVLTHTDYPETTNATNTNKRSWNQQAGIGCKYLSGNNHAKVQTDPWQVFHKQVFTPYDCWCSFQSLSRWLSLGTRYITLPYSPKPIHA